MAFRNRRRNMAAGGALGLFMLAQGCSREEPPVAVPLPPIEAVPPVAQPLAAPMTFAPRRIDPDPAFLQALAGTLLLVQDRAPSPVAQYGVGRQWRASSTAGTALLEAWEEPTGNGTRINAMRFDPASGSPQVLNLDPSGAIDKLPAVAGMANGNGYAVWTTQAMAGGDTQVVGQGLSAGGVTGARWSYRRGAGPVGDTALAAGNNDYLALWTENRGTGSGMNLLMGQKIGPNGDPVGNATLVSGTQSVPGQPGVAWSGDNFLAVWTDTRGTGSRVYGRILDASGMATGTELVISDGQGAAVNPSVSFNGQKFMVAWFDDRAGLAGAGDVFVQTVAKTGGMLGSNTVISGNRMVDWAAPPRVVGDNTQAMVVYSGRAVDSRDARAVAPSAVFGALLTPGSTPSAPFVLGAVNASQLVDARSWGGGVVLLSEQGADTQRALDWSFYKWAGAGSSVWSGYTGYGGFGLSGGTFDRYPR